MGKIRSRPISFHGLFMVGALQSFCLLSLLHGSFAQNDTCNTATLSPLLPCLPYVEVGNTTRPASDCCDPLANLLASNNPTCICQIAPLAQQTGIKINQTRALEVAAACNQTIPSSVTSCLSGTPLGAPSSSPVTPSPPGGSNGRTDGASHGSALFPPSFLLIAAIFVALSLHLSMSA